MIENGRKLKLLFYTELWANAGIESVTMSLTRNFNLERISVDIMAAQNLSDFYDEEIERLGCRKLITLTEKYNSPAARMAANRNAFAEAIKAGEYDVVHINMCNASAMIYGRIAKENGAKTVVYHSHNTNLGTSHRLLKTAVHNICKMRYEKYADALLSCSDLASEWMFTRKAIKKNRVTLVKNAIDLEKFEYSDEKRLAAREKLYLGDKFTVGHIGRFAVAKNHSYLIDVFKAVHDKQPDAVLLLVGEGEDENAIKAKVHNLGLDDCVIFYGTTRDIPQMLWAMDAFVLPSLFEGNPVVGIEAQAASAPCFFSENITRMCALTENVEFISLKKSPEYWADEILKASGKSRTSNRETMRTQGYDIKETAKAVQHIYEKIAERAENQ